MTFDSPQGQIVHHVYCGGFNFAGPVTENETSLRMARQLLAAEYQATVLADWEMSQKYPEREGSARLILTGIG
jgi:hypothetical protein